MQTRDKIAVFLGPTLNREIAQWSLSANYFPPADQGAIFHVLREIKPKTIVLIDGVFGHVPAVRHKEILWAMYRGARVFGASSIGALRAAELHTLGMIGYGLIYRFYRQGVLIDDDEVAVATSPVELGATALSEALINMRVTFRRARLEKIISPTTSTVLESIAQSIYFTQRSYERTIEEARDQVTTAERKALDRLKEWLPTNCVDQKKEDALGLLKHVASGRFSDAPNSIGTMHITKTWYDDLQSCGFDMKEF